MTPFLEIYLPAGLLILAMMSLLWLVSISLENASIVDIFWGTGFVVVAWFYWMHGGGEPLRRNLVVLLTTVWGLRLSLYLAWRNIGKGEDFRYRQFRQHYGRERYWWISFFRYSCSRACSSG